MELVTTITIGGETRPFPFLADIWDFFLEKGSRTVFVSVGNSGSPLAELEIGESLGCPIHIFDNSEETGKSWEEVKTLLKTRKVEETTSEFAKVAAKKWVLAKNIVCHSGLPFGFSGTHKDGFPLTAVQDILTDAKPEELRIDILKIDKEGWEDILLASLLAPGFRPSLIMVSWSASPNENYRTMTAVGNLTMMGYRLVERIENRCLYYFTGMSLYETADWYIPKCKNPLITSLLADYILTPKTETPAVSTSEAATAAAGDSSQ